MAYANAADALHRLLTGQEESCRGAYCHITSMPSQIKRMSNGMEYFAVEVTCSDGVQYNIPAYGAEAVDLYSEALLSIMPLVTVSHA